jgi:hypothetical protein
MTTITQSPKTFTAAWRHLIADHGYTIKQLREHQNADEDLMTIHAAEHGEGRTYEHGHTA